MSFQDENERKVQFVVLINNEQMKKKKRLQDWERRHWLARMWLGKPKAVFSEGSWSEDAESSGESKIYGVCIGGEWVFAKGESG